MQHPLMLAAVAAFGLLATPVYARRRGGGGGHGEDPAPWLPELMAWIVLGFIALAIVGALWRYFTRPSSADLARARSEQRLSRRHEKDARRTRH